MASTELRDYHLKVILKELDGSYPSEVTVSKFRRSPEKMVCAEGVEDFLLDRTRVSHAQIEKVREEVEVILLKKLLELLDDSVIVKTATEFAMNRIERTVEGVLYEIIYANGREEFTLEELRDEVKYNLDPAFVKFLPALTDAKIRKMINSSDCEFKYDRKTKGYSIPEGKKPKCIRCGR